MSRSTPKPTVVSFRNPLPLKKSESRKRNANAGVKEVLPPNGVLPLAFKPCEPMRRRKKKEKKLTKTMMKFHPSTCFLTSRPCNPKNHVANLVVAEIEDDDRPFCFQGEHCLRDFLEWLDTLTLNDTRQVNVIAHNFQG